MRIKNAPLMRVDVDKQVVDSAFACRGDNLFDLVRGLPGADKFAVLRGGELPRLLDDRLDPRPGPLKNFVWR